MKKQQLAKMRLDASGKTVHVIAKKDFDPTEMLDIIVVEHQRIGTEDRVKALINDGYKCYGTFILLDAQLDGAPYHKVVSVIAKPQ